MKRRPLEDRPHAIDVGGESRTKQSFAEESEINNIMARYEKTGLLEHVVQYKGNYGDFTNAPVDYAQAMTIVREAREMFMTLPPQTRERFANDPGEFLEFVDSASPEDLRAAGLLPAGSQEPAEAGDGAAAPPEVPQAASEPPSGGNEAD